MFFQWLRKQFKWLIVVVSVAFAVGLLYVGVPFIGETPTTNAAVARVNGSDVTFEEHQAAFQNLVMQYQMLGGGLSPSDQDVLRYQALEMVVNTKLILDAAKKEGVKVTNDQIDAELDVLREMFSSTDEYEAALQQAGLTERELRRQIEDDLIIQKAIEEKQETIDVSEEEIAAAYEAVNARHILIRPEEGEGELDWDAAEEQVKELYEQLLDGADFAELAQEYSDDATATNGGELGFFQRGRMVPEFEETAFALEEGEISAPVRTEYGYHLIEVIERRRAEGEEFEEEKEFIRDQIVNERTNAVLDEWIDSLRDSAQVEIHDPLMQALQYVANGQQAQAIAWYEQAEEQNSGNGYINYSLGRVYESLDDPERAIEQYTLATMKEEHDPELHFALAGALLAQDRVDEAVESFMAASEWAPNDFMLQSQVIAILEDLGYEEELTIIEERVQELIERMEEQERLMEQQMQQQQLEDDQLDLEERLDAATGAAAQEESENELEEMFPLH